MKPSQVKLAVNKLIDFKRPVFLWGPPGIGKSDIVRQIAENRDFGFIDKRLSQSDPTELKGYPWPDQKSGTMKFFRDDELPTKGKGILFLDEFNTAPQAVQAPAYQLILDRKLGSYTLPDGWAVIAAGNRSSDRSNVHAMAAALKNRFVHIDVTPDVDEWITWALKNGIHDSTRGYLKWRPANLFTDKFDQAMRAFPSPRSWAFADKIANDPEIDPDVKTELLVGTIGEGTAVEYMGFIRDEVNLPNLNTILMTPDKAKVPDKASTQYAIVAKLESVAAPNNLSTLLKYISRLPKEFEVMFVHSCMRRGDDKLTETQAITQWIAENHALIV